MPIEGLTPGPANAAPLDFSIHTQPSFDVANLLPPAASERLLQLRQRAKEPARLPHRRHREQRRQRVAPEGPLAFTGSYKAQGSVR